MRTRTKTLAASLIAMACLAGGLALTASTASAAGSYTKVGLDGRTVKDPNVPVGAGRVADRYPAGSKITLVCQDEGPAYHGSGIWDLTTDGLWVPDAFVTRKPATMVLPRCAIPKKFAAKTDLNGRKNKGDAADAAGAKNNAYQKGAQIPVDCQTVAKGVIWDHTTDGWWVPDTYVKTGSDGFVSGLPRCDTDGVGSAPETPGSTVHGRSNGPAGPTAGTRAQRIQRVIDAAKSQVGKGYDYAWGAGGKGGASYGVHHYPSGNPAYGDDYNRYGYDCSGLTLYAFWKGAGIDIGEWTGKQYRAGTLVSLNQLQPGDLVFWGKDDDANSTTHVALYLGDNQILEAAPPRDGKSVHITTLYNRSGLTAHAVRVIA